MMSTISEYLEKITFFTSYVETPAADKTKRHSDRDRLIQELKEEIAQETYNAEKKEKLEAEQMRWRRRHLQVTEHLVRDHEKAFKDQLLRWLEEEEWKRYMSCDGLPDPTALPQLNTFLFLWSLDDAAASMKTLPRQCEIVTHLTKKMDDVMEFSLRSEPDYINDFQWIQHELRRKLQFWIDMASYAMLRQIEKETIRVDMKNAKYVQQLAPLICCFWILIRLPISMKQILEKDRKPIEVSFDEVGLDVKMPADLDCYCTTIRILWYGYDHYSDLAVSFNMPELAPEYRMDIGLLDFCQREYDRLTELREEQREGRAARLEEKRAMIGRIMKPPASAAESGKGRKKHSKKSAEREVEPVPVLPPLSTPEQIVLQHENEIIKERRRLLFTRCKKTEVNLRKYAILGGLYRIDLIYQPPQPKDMRCEKNLTTLQLPKTLQYVEYSRPYKAPPPAADSERTPEVIEAEIKALEAAMEALALVTLKLPDSVMWFEPPLVAHWLEDERVWSTEDVHDIKYNEEKQTIAFRTGRLGLHALAGYRFVNLPFQSWELKPETGKSAKGGIILSITGAIIQLEFLVREEMVCLHSMVGGGSTALQDLMHEFMRLQVLVLKMRAAGCDVFPEKDAVSYLKGLSPKHSVMVRHLQACMGLLSTAYVFSWSRWNATRPFREIVMQMKEVHGCIAKTRSNTMLLFVTPFRSSIVDCSEVSTEFSSQNVDENDKFYGDPYHYALDNAGIKSRLAMGKVSYQLSTTVTKLLETTGVIDFSA